MNGPAGGRKREIYALIARLTVTPAPQPTPAPPQPTPAPINPTPAPPQPTPAPNVPKRWWETATFWAGMAALTATLIGGYFVLRPVVSPPTDDTTAVSILYTETPALLPTDRPPADMATAIPTQTATPTVTPTLSPEQLALTPVTRNEDWEPVEREFNGVTMMLVPAGCFMMGSDDGDNDERPVHQQCFDEPFWISKYEVTRAEYQQCVDAGMCETLPMYNYSIEPEQPINYVSWFDATAYCDWRDARLPTEREWEYAARGPQSWIYAWGDTWVTENAISQHDPEYGNESTAPVGSRPAGASWVGAEDMNGNVWEWTSSIYRAYPYNLSNFNGEVSNQGVLRGGSFPNPQYLLRSAMRTNSDATNQYSHFGIRCARDAGG